MEAPLSDSLRFRRYPTLPRQWHVDPIAAVIVGLHVHKGWGRAERYLAEGWTFDLRRDVDNQHDPNAVSVHSRSGKIGYIGAEASAAVAELLDQGAPIVARPAGAPFAGAGSKGGNQAVWVGIS